MNSFERLEILYGEGFGKKLAASKALVCGLGAVGGFALEILARMGVGNFILADCDAFERSNINRQIGALESTLGLRKTDVMKGRVLDVNPAANVEIFDGYIDEKSIPNLLLKKPGIVVDAIDSIAPKISLIKAALSSDIKLVSSMGAARRKDPSFIKTAPVFKTRGCPVASAVRKALRGGGAASADFMCVFSDEILSESSHVASGGEGSKKIIGSSAVITSIFGVRLAGLAVEELTKNDTR